MWPSQLRRLFVFRYFRAFRIALIASAVVACGETSKPVGPPNVVLVTLDTARADRFGAHRRSGANDSGRESLTPVYDAFAARAVLFENASAVAPLTLPAHATLMTGRLPAEHGVRDNVGFRLVDSFRTIAESFRDAGYRTGGFVSAFVLDRRWGLAQGFETYLDGFTLPASGFELGAVQRTGDETVANALRWIDTGTQERFFAWIHLYDPHAPYAAPEPFAALHRGRPYDAEIAWTDSLLGRIFDSLERTGRSSNTVVAVIGDHGESLGEHGEAEHGYFVYESTQHVPFALRGPHAALRPRRFRPPVSQVDVAATLLEIAGVESAGIGGSSLVARLEEGPGDEEEPAEVYGESLLPLLHYGWAELRFVRSGRYKLISAPKPELFDLEADPGEASDLYASERRIAARLERRLAEQVASEPSPSPQDLPSDTETRRALAALGYASPAPRAPSREEKVRPDPKEKLPLHREIQRAQFLGATDPVAAAGALRAVLDDDPGVVQAWQTLGEIESRAGNWRSAASAFGEALRHRPDHVWAAIGRAEALSSAGESAAAIETYVEFLLRPPDNAEIRYRLGVLHLERGEVREAREQLRRAVELSNDFAAAHLALANTDFRDGELASAKSRLERALALDPRTRGAGHLEGQLLEAEGRIDGAIEAYRAEIARHPDSPRTSFQLGALLEKSGRPEEAVDAYRAAATNDRVEAARFFLSRSLFTSGDREAARREAEAALALHPEGPYSALGHYVLADLALARGETAEAARQAAMGRALERRYRHATREAPAPESRTQGE